MLQLLHNDNRIYIFDANRFFLRLRGLIGRELQDDFGLLLTPCNQIHTFFMKQPIDVIYLTKENKILFIEEQVPPNLIKKKRKDAKKILELKGGTAEKMKFQIGDILVFGARNN